MTGMNTQNKLTLEVNTQAQLTTAYMPYIKNGGIFIKTSTVYEFGKEVHLDLTLFSSKVTISGKVIWIAENGVGIQFAADAIAKDLRSKIENYLTGTNDAHRFALPS